MKFQQIITRHWFAIAVVVAAAIHLTTLTISPTISQGEVQIIEFGRCFLNPDTEWSIVKTESGQPAATLYYVGPLIQELSYLATRSPVGPRLTSLLAAILAAIGCRLWLVKRGHQVALCSIIALILLLDPIFVKSYRGARVDALSIGSLFFAMALIRMHANEARSLAKRWTIAFLVGFLVAFSAFVWLVAVIIWPLLVYEFWIANNGIFSRSKQNSAKPDTYGSFVFCAIGFVTTASMICGLAGPDYLNRSMFATMDHGLGDLTSLFGNDGLGWRMLVDGIASLSAIGLSPFLPVFAIVLMGCSRNRIIGPIFLLIFLFMLATRFYGNRYVYLLPYLVLVVAQGIEHLTNSLAKPRLRSRIVYGIAGLLLGWAILISLVARPTNAILTIESRDPQTIYDAAEQTVGNDGHVFLYRYDFYYAGRELNWFMFRSRGFDPRDKPALFESVEFVVANSEQKFTFPENVEEVFVRRSDDAPDRFQMGATGYENFTIYCVKQRARRVGNGDKD